MLHQIKAQPFYTDLDLYQLCSVQQKIVEFKDFSRLLSDSPVLFKADLIFKDFSKKPSKFKYFFKPVRTLQGKRPVRYAALLSYLSLHLAA